MSTDSSKGRDWYQARYGKAAADHLFGKGRNEDGELEEPSAEQERAWDSREDDIRGHAL